MNYAIQYLNDELLRYKKALESWEVKSKITHSESFKLHSENISELEKAIKILSDNNSLSLRVTNVKTGESFRIQKLIVERDGRISIWCNEWYGHHIIGQDCEFLK